MNSIGLNVVIAFGFGIVFLIVLLVIADKYPIPTPFQSSIFRLLLALVAAGVGAMLPGIIHLDLTLPGHLTIGAGGALAMFVMAYFFDPGAKIIPPPPAALESAEDIKNSRLLKPILRELEPDLTDALALAALAARRDGKNVVDTHYFLGALGRLQSVGRNGSEQLSTLLEKLPSGALPPPIAFLDVPNKAFLNEPVLFSRCVRDSLTSLVAAAKNQKVSSKDVFVDIAKHGHAASVNKMRQSGVTPEYVDNILSRIQMNVLERRDHGSKS